MPSATANVGGSASLQDLLRSNNDRSSAAASFTPSRNAAYASSTAGYTPSHPTGSTLVAVNLLARTTAVHAGLSTPCNDIKHTSVLATPLSRTAGGKVGSVRPCMLDEYIAKVEAAATGAVAPAARNSSSCYTPLQASPYRQPTSLAAGAGSAMPLGSSRRQHAYDLGRQAASSAAPGSLATPSALTKAAGWHNISERLEELKQKTQRVEAVNLAALNSRATPPNSARGPLDFSIPAMRTSLPSQTPGQSSAAAAGGGRAGGLPGGAPPSVSIRLSCKLDNAAGRRSPAPMQPPASSSRPAVPLYSSPGSASMRDSPTSHYTASAAASSSSPGSLGTLQQELRHADAQLQQAQQARAGAGLYNSSQPAAPSSAWAGPGLPGEQQLWMSRINQLQAEVRSRDMQLQEASTSNQGLQQQLAALQEQADKQSQALAVAQQIAARAEVRRADAEQAAAALREEVGRRQSAHADNTEAVTRLQAVSEVQRQENEELRSEVHRLSGLLDEQLKRGAHLQASLIQSQTCASDSAGATARQLDELAAAHQRQLEEARQQAAADASGRERHAQLLQLELTAALQRAEEAQRRRQEAEGRAQELQAQLVQQEHQALDGEQRLEGTEQRVVQLEREAKALRQRLDMAEQERQQAEDALQQEREHALLQGRHSSAVQQSEAALTSQLKAMAAQLRTLQAEAAALRSDKAELEQRVLSAKAAGQAELSSAEARAVAAEEKAVQVEARLEQRRQELEQQFKAAEEQRRVVAQLQQGNRELQAALREHESGIMARNQQIVSLQAEAEAMRVEASRLSQQLHDCKAALAAAEDRLAKAGRAGLGGSSPLREMVNALQSETAEREAALAQVQEDLSRERSRGADLQRQVLQQAVELDDAQRELSDALSTRQQLATAQQTEAQLRRRLAELQQQLAGAISAGSPAGSSNSSGSSGAGSGDDSTRQGAAAEAAALRTELAAVQAEAGRLRQEVERLREEQEGRELEVMQLQGQVRLLQQRATDAENWLLSP